MAESIIGSSDLAALRGERTFRAFSAWVEEEPVLAVTIALCVGYVGAWVLRR